MATCRSTVE